MIKKFFDYLSRLKSLKTIRNIQGECGNWNSSEYQLGLYNGLELAVAIMDNLDPQLRDAPKTWVSSDPVTTIPDQWIDHNKWLKNFDSV